MLLSSLETPTLGLMPGDKNTSLSSSLKLVNALCGKVSQQTSTISRISSMLRSRVNMTIAQLTASLSAHQPRNIFPKDHTGGSSPFVETTAPLTTVGLEGKGNGDMAQGLTRSPPRGPEQQDPLPSNLTPRTARADYPFPCLKVLTPPTNGSATRLQFCSELEANNTGHLDFTNNSGVQDFLVPAPQTMAHESNQSKMPLGCSLFGNGYQGLVIKESRPGSQATGRPVHFNSVLSTKTIWRLSTYHQPPCSKPVLVGGVLQDEGTASSEISITAGRLHDEIRPEGCILRNSDSSLPQKVSEVHLLGQSIRVSVPSLWPVLSSTGIYKDTEVSAGSVAVYEYPGCDLHRRHVITPPTEQGAAENLCSSGRPPGKAGLSGEKREVFSHSLPTSNLSRSSPALHYNAS